jgi:hypothetical protein
MVSGMDNEFRVSRLLRIFGKSGCWGNHSREFFGWPESTQQELRRWAGLTDSERPFIAYVERDRWTVLTLERVIWRSGEHIQSVGVGELAEITVTDQNSARLTPYVKETMDELKLRTKHGRTLSVTFEPGRPLIGFWNVVKMMISQNASEPGAAGSTPDT